MFLDKEQRVFLEKLAEYARNLASAIDDTKQLSEKGHFTSLISLDSAVILANKINAGLGTITKKVKAKDIRQ